MAEVAHPEAIGLIDTMPEARDALGGQRFFRHVLPRTADDVQICQATQEDWCPILLCSNTWWQRRHKQFEVLCGDIAQSFGAHCTSVILLLSLRS